MMPPACQLVDLSHTFEPEMTRFSEAVPPPKVDAWLSHAQAAKGGHYKDCSCEVSRVEFITSLGTYLDSPYHFHPGMGDVATLEIGQLVLPGLVVDVSHIGPQEPIGPACLDGLDIAGKAVLFRTGFSRHWGGPEYFRHPYLSRETALALIAGGARLAGTDTLNVDNHQDPTRPAHVNLLGSQVLVVENLTALEELPPQGFWFSAAPLKYAGAAAFPVRAYAMIF